MLLDAAWAIPVAAVAAVASLMFERGTRAAGARAGGSCARPRPRGHGHLPRRSRRRSRSGSTSSSCGRNTRRGTRLGACSRSATASEPRGSGKASASPRPSSRRRSARSTSAPSRRRTSSALPADTYARGFLRTYADYLGLDGEIYVDEYASRFHNAEWDDELRPAPGAGRGARAVSGRSSAERSSSCSPGSRSSLRSSSRRGATGTRRRTFRRSTSNHNADSRGLVLRGVANGDVRRRPAELEDRPAPLPRHARRAAASSGSPERRFYVAPRRPAGVRITRSPGVTLLRG